MTGAGTSVARTGNPDLALTTATEMIANAAAICANASIPVIADADTGYGEVLNVRRTIRQYEQAGVAAVHIEDQESPKRCGHLDNKNVVTVEEMVRKLAAAVDARTDDDFLLIARTDAVAVNGWDDAMHRCEAYLEAGADALFVEAIPTRERAQELAHTFDVPLLYNFVETGKSPLLSVEELDEMGFKIVIFPATALLSATQAISHAMRELKSRGTTAHLIENHMVSLIDCFETVGLSHMLEIDADFANR
jgi:2-methylisocitrate lyase-like PEP mutase family enzyme